MSLNQLSESGRSQGHKGRKTKAKNRFHVEWFPLDEIGLSSHVYHHLHRNNRQGLPCPYVTIPDTIVFWGNKATAWFFTSDTEPHKILRKNKSNVTNSKIRSHLCRRYLTKRLEVCAVFMSRNRDNQISFEYLTPTELKDLLEHRPKPDGSVLQGFVQPQGSHNSVIKVDWSLKRIDIEERVSMCRLHDTTSTAYQRVVTYDGAEHNSVAGPVRRRSHEVAVRLACEALAGHLFSTTNGGETRRMVLFFKVDKQGRACFLWAAYFKIHHPLRPTFENYMRRVKGIERSFPYAHQPPTYHRDEALGEEDAREGKEEEAPSHRVPVPPTRAPPKTTSALNSGGRGFFCSDLLLSPVKKIEEGEGEGGENVEEERTPRDEFLADRRAKRVNSLPIQRRSSPDKMERRFQSFREPSREVDAGPAPPPDNGNIMRRVSMAWSRLHALRKHIVDVGKMESVAGEGGRSRKNPSISPKEPLSEDVWLAKDEIEDETLYSKDPTLLWKG